MGAACNSQERSPPPRCLPGTREEVLETIDAWAEAVGGDRVLWLHGPAGAGKSAIAQTVAETCTESRTAIAESKEKALNDLNDALLAQSMVYRDERENALRRVEALKLRVGREEEEILRLKKENQEMHSIVLDQAERKARAEKENQKLKVGVGKYVPWLLRDLGIPRALLVIALVGRLGRCF